MVVKTFVMKMAPAKALAGLLVPSSLDSGRGQLRDCKNKLRLEGSIEEEAHGD